MVKTSTHDVAVVGAGPAGTSTAAILAEHGHDVVIVEKDAFPRYRVGESLIPYCWFPLNRLGLVERLDKAAFVVRKFSVQFVGVDGQVTTPFYFQKHSDHDSSRTWQVVRSEFDALLTANAVEKGAQIRTGVQARSLIMDDDRVDGITVRDEAGEDAEIRARVTIDASGRDLFACSRTGWRIRDPKLSKIAVWTYYRGAHRDCGIDEGATTVAYLPDKGWFWYIPLPDDIVSVGVVADRDYLYRGDRDPQTIFDREVAAQPWIAEHLASGKQIEQCKVTGDYSYRSRHCAMDGLVLVGDAFAFLDPVFSSGVFLALHSGVAAGDAVHDALIDNDVSARRFAEYGENVRRGIEAMRRLVYAFYDTTFSFGAFMKEHPELSRDLTDCLIGNVYKDLEPLFEAIGESVDLPPALDYGQPLVTTSTP